MPFDRDRAQIGIFEVFEPESKQLGTGFLAEGGCILTVAHNFHPKLPDPTHYRARSVDVIVRRPGEQGVPVLVSFADTCLDMAILGTSGAHGDLFDDEIEDFQTLSRAMVPQPIQLIKLDDATKFSVSVYSIDAREWIHATASLDQSYPHYLLLEADGPITHGMSGGPVFNDEGKAIGCLLGSCTRGNLMAFANCFSACLPGWALDAHRSCRAWTTGYSKTFLNVDLDKAAGWHVMRRRW